MVIEVTVRDGYGSGCGAERIRSWLHFRIIESGLEFLVKTGAESEFGMYSMVYKECL